MVAIKYLARSHMRVTAFDLYAICRASDELARRNAASRQKNQSGWRLNSFTPP
jgi:hypothetical protein